MEEINTALSIEGENFFFTSMDEVKQALEEKGESYRNRSITYGSVTASLLGAGAFGKIYPRVLEEQAEVTEFLTVQDLANLGLVGGILASIYPGRKAKRYRDSWKTAENQVRKIEEESFDDSSTDFAYEIVETLDDPGIDIIHRMSEAMP